MRDMNSPLHFENEGRTLNRHLENSGRTLNVRFNKSRPKQFYSKLNVGDAWGMRSNRVRQVESLVKSPWNLSVVGFGRVAWRRARLPCPTWCMMGEDVHERQVGMGCRGEESSSVLGGGLGGPLALGAFAGVLCAPAAASGGLPLGLPAEVRASSLAAAASVGGERQGRGSGSSSIQDEGFGCLGGQGDGGAAQEGRLRVGFVQGDGLPAAGCRGLPRGAVS